MFELITYLQFLTFVAGLAIAIYVFVRHPKDGLHQALAVAALGMAGWNLSIFLIINEIINLELGVRHSFAWASWTAVGFTWFIYQYPRRVRYYKWFSASALFLGLLFFLIPFYPSFVLEAHVPGGYVDVTFGPALYPLWSLFFLGNFLYTVVIILIRAKRARGVDRHRLMQILLGFSFFFIPAQFSNLLLPLLLDDFRWNNLGPIFTIFLIFFMLNAVMRYRLLNIRWILGKSFFFSAVIAAILWVVASVVFLVSDIFGNQIGFIMSALVIAIFFKPMWDFMERVFSRLINFGTYQPEKATEELFNIVRNEGNLDVLADQLIERFSSYFATKSSALVIFEPDSTKIAVAKCLGYKNLCSQRAANELAKLSRETGLAILEKNEIIWNQQFGTDKKKNGKEEKLLSVMKKSDIETLIPLITDNKLVGLIMFGGEGYHRTLRSSDIQFLELVRSGISPALENAAKLEQTQKLLARLSELDKAKSEFINIVSHRFRTPLSAIRWNLETILDVHKKRIGKEVAGALMDSQDRTLFLVETLDRLFDSLAIESGKLKLHNDYFNTKDAFAQATEEYERRCKEKGVICKVKIQSFRAWGDAHRLASVLRSLMSNALQYTASGQNVLVEITKVQNGLELSVTDTGIGIPKAAMKKIFEKFYRAKNAVLTYADGQGLGMFYSKEITTLHGGKIDVQSELNKGTSVTISIPIKAQKLKKKAKKK